ncbi:MAG: heme-binding protein [Myxococcales bacterium]|nr:MAG: heme-binding protein [Myxococcales bacterium]
MAVIATCVFAAVAFGGRIVAYESPKYRVTEQLGSVEIREYEPYLVAETVVDGTIESAGNRGFRILARYIFGANRDSRKVSMTSPVTQEKAEGTKLAMTTPVTQAKRGDQYTIRFMMPSEYSRDSLPTPNDARVQIREVPTKVYAAIRYSGTWSRRNYDKHLEELRTALSAEGFESVGEPVWARYNPPFTPWFLRRNEILTEFRPAVARQDSG